MTAKLYSLVQQQLLANLDRHSGLNDVILDCLPDELTESEVEECRQILSVMLAAANAFVKGLRPMGPDSSN